MYWYDYNGYVLTRSLHDYANVLQRVKLLGQLLPSSTRRERSVFGIARCGTILQCQVPETKDARVHARVLTTRVVPQGTGTGAFPPAQVLVQETDGGRKAKFSTAFGEPEYNPPPQNQQPMERTKLERAGQAPIAEIRLVYRDLLTLQNRGVIARSHCPDWLSAPPPPLAPSTQIRRARTATPEKPSHHRGFQPGEVVDLTA